MEGHRKCRKDTDDHRGGHRGCKGHTGGIEEHRGSMRRRGVREAMQEVYNGMDGYEEGTENKGSF